MAEAWTWLSSEQMQERPSTVKLALEPESEPRFEANSYGFRPGRCTMDERCRLWIFHRADHRAEIERDLGLKFAGEAPQRSQHDALDALVVLIAQVAYCAGLTDLAATSEMRDVD